MTEQLLDQVWVIAFVHRMCEITAANGRDPKDGIWQGKPVEIGACASCAIRDADAIRAIAKTHSGDWS